MKLLILSDFLCSSGLARITRLILRSLEDRHDLHVLPLNATCSLASDLNGVTVHHRKGVHDPFHMRTAGEVAGRLQPDVAIIYHDFWRVPDYVASIRSASPKTKFCAYVPVENRCANTLCAESLKNLDCIIAFSRFGAEQIFSQSILRGLSTHRPFDRIVVIPHSIDTPAFYPMFADFDDVQTRRRAARQLMFRDSIEARDGFWVLSVAQNTFRKRLDLALAGFAKFALNKPRNVKLILHSSRGEGAFKLGAIADELGVRDRVIFTSPGTAQPDFTEEQLNLLYNTCDVGLSTSAGEAWGLPAFEHACTGAPQLVPDIGTQREVWNGAASLISIEREHDYPSPFTRSEISVGDVAARLDALYGAPDEYSRLMNRCYAHARSTNFQFDPFRDAWRAVIERFSG